MSKEAFASGSHNSVEPGPDARFGDVPFPASPPTEGEKNREHYGSARVLSSTPLHVSYVIRK